MSAKIAAQFEATPQKTLMDETLEVTAWNLRAGQTVTVVAITINAEDGVAFYAHGEFQANEQGSLDVNRSFSFRGTYVGTESMGLFWSAIPAPGQKRGLRLIKRVVEMPLIWRLFLIDGSIYGGGRVVEDLVSRIRQDQSGVSSNGESHRYDYDETDDRVEPAQISSMAGGNVIGSAVVERYYCREEDVDQIPIRDGRVRGILFVPKYLRSPRNSLRPRIGIIDIYGGASFKTHRAALLAERGFIVLALAYVGYDDLPKDVDVDVDYLVETADFMLSGRCPMRIDSKRGLGVIGLCKGATLALEMAVHHNRIEAVVAINSPCFNEIGCFRRPGSNENIAHVWDTNNPLLKRTEDGLVTEDLFEWFDRKSADEKQRLGIAVEKIESVLFVYGEDDVSIGVRNLNYFLERLRSARKNNYRCLVYPKTGHMIDPPTFPLCHSSYWPLFKDIFVWGGEARSHHQAQVDSWNQILEYFTFRLTSTPADQ